MFMEEIQQPPEIRVEDRIAAGQIEAGRSAVDLTEIQAVVKGLLHFLPGHGSQARMAAGGEDITMLTPLVAFVCDMPLK
jgi:hypothetical protein